jgi:glycosyltransferase involved in cell wall biosynthesis
VTNQLPWPPHSGGQRREFELLRRLAGRHEIHLLAVGPEKRTPGKCAEESILGPLLVSMSQYRIVLTGASRLPTRMAEHFDTQVKSLMKRAIKDIGPDVVHIEGFFLMYGLPVEAPPIVLAAENIESDLVVSPEGGKAQGPREIIRAAETAAWCRADVLVAVSAQDAHIIKTSTGSGVVIVPNSGSHVARSGNASRKLGDRVAAGYVANYTWEPSQEAARLLLRLWPAIHSRTPGSHLYLVGAGLSPHLGKEAEAVTVVGAVPGMELALESLDVFLCPSDVVSGSKLKMHEAIHMGLPIVTLEGGIGGFPGRAMEGGILLARSHGQLVELAVRLLSDPELRGALSARVLEYAGRLPTWEVSAANLERAWLSAAG